MEKIGFGGGCHWCTEAVFLSLRGVQQVEQGWIAPLDDRDAFSEAVIVHFEPAIIDLPTLVAVHLHTHSSTSNHALRLKYRSAVYFFYPLQKESAQAAIDQLRASFPAPLITTVLPFHAFRPSEEAFRDYYYQNPLKPFCETHIHPKLHLLLQLFSKHAAPGLQQSLSGHRHAI